MNENIFDNTKGVRIIIDCWSDETYSYAVIIYPDNILHLQWTEINE